MVVAVLLPAGPAAGDTTDDQARAAQ